MKRRGHTEAALDLSRLAGRRPAGVLCEICNDDGSMARLPELKAFCRKHGGLVLTSIADLVAYRHETERETKKTREGEEKGAGGKKRR
jgi:3,4-dihydroxy 2-butanone 4-phosphate synthase / GTP cyclohydrolase II